MSDLANKQVHPPLFKIGDVAKTEAGLTLREHFAGLALQGLLAANALGAPTVLCQEAVIFADALIAELSKTDKKSTFDDRGIDKDLDLTMSEPAGDCCLSRATTLPYRLGKLRQRLGWSQARMATELGVSQPTIWRIERGRQDISKSLAKLLDVLEERLRSVSCEIAS